MRILFLLTATAALSAGLAMAQGTGLPLVRITGIVGIGSGQTARLNVLNPGIGAPFLGIRCTSTLFFLSDQGDQLKSNTVTVDPGKSASLEFSSEAFAGRVEVYALVSTPPIGQEPPNVGYCTLIPTIEVIDTATGNTVTVLTESTVRPPVPAPIVTPANRASRD